MKLYVHGEQPVIEPQFVYKLISKGRFLRLVQVDASGEEHSIVELVPEKDSDTKPTLYVCSATAHAVQRIYYLGDIHPVKYPTY